jgi:YjbR protein
VVDRARDLTAGPAGGYQRAMTGEHVEPDLDAEAQAAFDAIATRLLAEPDTDDHRAFHSPCLRVHRKIFAMLVRGELVVKLPPERCAELVEAREARPFDRGKGTPMRSWVTVDDLRIEAWPALAEEALAFGRDTAARRA